MRNNTDKAFLFVAKLPAPQISSGCVTRYCSAIWHLLGINVGSEFVGSSALLKRSTWPQLEDIRGWDRTTTKHMVLGPRFRFGDPCRHL